MNAPGDAPKPVVLHSSWRSRLLIALGPAFLLAWGGFGALGGGLRVINGVILFLGIVMAVVAAFDFPLRSVFGPDGIERQCLARTDRLAWDEIRSVARPAQQGVGSRLRSAMKISKSSGLVAERGKVPHMLVDRVESQAEFDAIQRGISAWQPGMLMRASRPVETIPPTWLHKRRRGSGDGLVDELD